MLTHISLPEGVGKKRVLIIGNGVSDGMITFYKQLLSGFIVHTLSTECLITDKYYSCLLDFALYQSRQEYDIICFTPSIDYNVNSEILQLTLKVIVRKIKAAHPKAKLVFPALTMVNPQVAGKEKNIKIYGCNKALEVLSSELGASYADLGTLSERIAPDHTPDGVLFTDMGYRKLAFEVIKYIK